MAEPSPPGPPAAPAAPPHLEPREVPWQHALIWFEDALRLFKRRPIVWIGLALLTLVTQFVFLVLPDPWPLLGNLLAPLVACGMLYAAAAADRHTPPRLVHAWRALGAPSSAVLSIVAVSLVTFGAEALTGWWVADVNLLLAHESNDQLTGSAVIGIYAIGVLASLPVAFVPLHVLFETVSPRQAFAASWQAFLLNTIPLLVYAAISLVLLAVGLATMGLALLLVLPIWAASSYTAWRDIFAIAEAPVVD